MNTYYLKRFRKRFSYRKSEYNWYVLVDHKQKKTTDCKSFNDLIETIVYRISGLDSYLSWASKRIKRKDRVSYYQEIKKKP